MEAETGGNINVGYIRESTTAPTPIYWGSGSSDTLRSIDTKTDEDLDAYTPSVEQEDILREKRKLLLKSLERCKRIYSICERITDEEIDVIERGNALATIVDLLYENYKEFKEIREHEFTKFTMLLLQALDYETIENINREKSIAVRDVLNIYRNGRISEQDVFDARKILRKGGLDILRPLTGEF